MTLLRPIHLFTFAVILAFPQTSEAADASAVFQSRVLPVLKTYCARCHGAEKQEAKVNLMAARDLEQLSASRELWFRVLEQIEAQQMPPADEKQPSALERKAIVDWVRGDFTELLIAKQRRQGRAKLRRLSRNEYINTFQDLFGIRPAVGLNLPEDGRVDGYDKVGAALPLSSSAAGGYFKMTEDLLNWVLKPVAKPKENDGAAPASRMVRVEARESGESAGHSLKLADGTVVSFNSDTSSGGLKFGTRFPGVHRVRLSVYGYQTDKPLAFGIYAGHVSAYPQLLDLLKVLEAPPGKAAVIETEIYLRSRDLNDRSPVGDGVRLIPFGLGVQVPKNSLAKNCTGPGLAVQWMEIEEPELPISADRWLTADFPAALQTELRWSSSIPLDRQIALQKEKNPKNQAKSTHREEFLNVMRATVLRIGPRLYRRDLSSAEIDKIMSDIAQQVDDGARLEAIFFDQVTDMLTSPDFLCVLEQPGELSDFALASRLSYFLWNSTPDEQLLDVARQGKLRDPQTLREHTERLLNDPKSGRFVTDFVNQWLGLRAIDDTSPDRNLYPEYNEFLKLSSTKETEQFFRQVLDENLSVRNFVDAPWALVNEDLAKHYGLAEVVGGELRKVSLPAGSPYGGLWTQSAVLKVTANGTNTSPVKRGVWVSERLLGVRIPPPPPNINPVEPDVRGAKTLREQLALHRGSGSCAACHAKFDPYGFALESFDVTGEFRKNYREVDPEVVAMPAHTRKGRRTWREGLPVDSSGETPDGQALAGVQELRKLLAKHPEQLARGVTRHLVTYATGAPPTTLDQPAVERIVNGAAPDDFGLRSLVHALVQSELFRWK